MLKYRFDNFLSFLKNKNIIILTHDLVDIDGLASAFTLKYFLMQYFNGQKISIYFSEFTKLTKNFLKKISEKFPDFDFSFNQIFELSVSDVIIIVDTNNLKQVNLDAYLDLSNLDIPILYIDHHYQEEKSENNNTDELNLIFENYSSTVEIILEFFKLYNVFLTTAMKLLMTSAILTDSGFFKHGNNNTIQNVSGLIDENINIQEIYSLLKDEIDISEKIANIKGMQRVKLIRENEFLIGITKVSSYGASVANNLIKLGFDVAVVLSKEENQNRISTRAKKVVCINTGLHLGKMLKELSGDYEGNGGGHDGAASIITKTESDLIITQIIEKIKHYLQSKF